MRPHVYPGSSLVVIDVAGSITTNSSGDHALLGRGAPESSREATATFRRDRNPCDPVIVAHQMQSKVRLDLWRGDLCCGWLELTVRYAGDTMPATPGVIDAAHSSYAHTRVDLDSDPQLRLRYLLPRTGQVLSKHAKRCAESQPLGVSPSPEVRLLLQPGGHRRGLSIMSVAGDALAQVQLSARSNVGTPTGNLRALLTVRATSVNIYDFGVPPTPEVSGPKTLSAHPQQRSQVINPSRGAA